MAPVQGVPLARHQAWVASCPGASTKADGRVLPECTAFRDFSTWVAEPAATGRDPEAEVGVSGVLVRA